MDISTWLTGPPPAKGQFQRYPGRFIFNVKKYYPELVGENTLHMFSGSCDFGVTTDSRPESKADYICDFHDLPELVGERRFDSVLCDPPYADHYQKQWGGELPKPKHILEVASKVVKTGGLIAILHIIVIPAYKQFKIHRVGLHPILSGPNNAMRVLNVFRKGLTWCPSCKGDYGAAGYPFCPAC